MSSTIEFDWSLLSYNEYVVLDIETTGFSPAKGGRIIEIGAVKIKNNEIIEKFSTFINPELKIPAKITELTGITNDMVANAPVIGKVLLDFKQFIGNLTIVAHNSPFDWDRFLLNGFTKVGIHPTNKVIDTKILFKVSFPKIKKHNLSEMCNCLDIPIEGHHRAFEDATMTAKAFILLKEKNSDKFITQTFEEKDIETKPSDIVIKRVKYWEKAKTKNTFIKRLYVNLFCDGAFGNVYFDIGTNCWYVKECANPIDLYLVEKKVLAFLNLNNKNELCEYKN